MASAPFAETVDPLEPLFVGSQGNNNTRHPEEVAEFRVVRGLARYRGDFVPPARRFEEAENAAGDRGGRADPTGIDWRYTSQCSTT